MDKKIYPSNQRPMVAARIFALFFCCLISSLLSIQTTYAQLQGAYTIGTSGADFVNFGAAVEALEREGTSGPVTFSIQPGTYQEQLVINNFTGSSCNNPVTFEGTGTTRAEVILEAPAGSVFTIQLNGADGIRFRHMAIAHNVEVNAGSDCFTLEDNTIRGSVLTTSTANARNNQHRYQNNLFQTGRIVIDNEAPWDPEAPVFDEGLLIEANEVSSISINGQQGFNILDNEVEVTGQQGIGIAVTNSWYGHAISGNRVSANVDNYQGTGMVLNSAAAGRITENSISTRDGGFAFLFTTGKSMDNEILVANNRITSDGYDARGNYYKPISNLVGLDIINNHNNMVKIYHNTLQVVGYSDYVPNYALSVSGAANSFHILNNAIVNYAYGWAVIAEPSAIAEMNYNNIVADSDDFGRWGGQATSSLTEWQNVTGLDEHSIAAGHGFPHEDYVGAGIYVEEVPHDYYGHTRNDPPTIGAVETAPTRTPLTGIFTIGGEDPDFTTFAEAMAALDKAGIQDSIVFMVRPGEYTEQLNLGSFGLDARITFEGESGDSTDVILRYPLDDAIVLNSTSNFSLRHMTVMAGIQISGGTNMLFESNIIQGGVRAYTLSRDTYRNNLFLEQGISKSGEGVEEQQGQYFYHTDGGARILGNTFQVEGVAISLDAQSNVIINDNHITIEGGESTSSPTAISTRNSEDIKQIRNNTIVSKVPNTLGFSFGGIFFAAGLPQDLSHNRIELLRGGTGISVHSSGGSSPSMHVTNNMVSIHASTPSTGISLSRIPGDVNLYHNSVYLYGEESDSRVVFFAGEIDQDINLRNNIFANQAGGHVYVAEDFRYYPDKITSSDYNNLFTGGEILIQWDEAALTSLSEWQELTGFDENSLSVDPRFVSEENLTPANTTLAGAGTWLAAVPLDFFGNERNDPPTIGAVEIEEEGPRDPVALIPIVECVIRNPDGSLTATFGYHNPGAESVELPVGPDNFLNLMEYAGQPGSFASGRHEAVFHVVFEASASLSWTLGDTTLTVDRNSPACEEAVIQPVQPRITCVSELDRTLSLATLGYYNPNEAPVAIAAGRLNRMSGRQNQGQPTVFEPGLQEEAFAASYTGTLLWTLGTERAMVNHETPACTPSLQAVQPLLDCVSNNGDGTYTAHFGYDNPNTITVSAGFVLHNRLLPALPEGDERPHTFQPGRHQRVFSVPFRGQWLEWRLMGQAVRARQSASLACGAENARIAAEQETNFNEVADELTIYPNFFSKEINIRMQQAAVSPLSFRIYSLSGTLLTEKRAISQGPEAVRLDLQHLSQGAYILEIYSPESRKIFRIFKQ